MKKAEFVDASPAKASHFGYIIVDEYCYAPSVRSPRACTLLQRL